MIEDHGSNPEWFTAQRLVPAMVLIAVGGIFLLSNLRIVRLQDILHYWPVALMVAGVFWMADATDARQRMTGGMALAFGSILLANNLGLIPFNPWDLWPLFIIGAGVYMLIDRTAGPRIACDVRYPGKPASPGSWTRHETAIFGGGKRKVQVEDFQSAKYDCIFGGFEVDLRRSKIVGDSAILEINAIFGGAEVKVPANWSVVMQGMGIFGGFGDSTDHPDESDPDFKRLFVRGAAVFGGAEIKN